MSTTDLPDLSTLSFWEQPEDAREEAFRLLRDQAPLSWHRQPEGMLIPIEGGTGGFWAAVRHEDIRTISRSAERFCSGKGVMLEDVPELFLDAAQSFLAKDGAEHKALRGIVSAGFTPRQMRRLEDGIRADARAVVDSLADHEDGDFVELVAKRVPLMTIMRMLDVPEADREQIVHLADSMVSWNDPEFLDGREPIEMMGDTIVELHTYCTELVEARRASPGEDLISAMVQAEVDGRRLDDPEISAFFILISVAGNDTTRHTTSHGMLALTRFPDQRALLAEHMDSAVEEFVRWASPVMTFRRTATCDTELSGQPIADGEKIVMFYPSGNRDPRFFSEPERFDVTRDPNHHLGFGGGGPHYCMGAALARTQLKAVFAELLGRYPKLEVADPVLLVGNFINGIQRMPMHRGAAA
ncbi:MAG TPA: cytochrome P450 [Solirubrobacteraceae bacterium]|nr:cytochrome P450 [Solirubrobacteraceae bacterium]